MGEAVFARRASGLVREASLLDTIFFGMMNNAVAVCVWFALSAWYFYPGANPWIVSALTLPFSLIFATVWGILGGSMPRSGGSYVYNSRIIHPTIGLAVSWANAGFVMLAWIWVLAPWVGEVGLPIWASVMWQNPEAVSYWTQGVGLLIVSMIVNVVAFVVVMLGLRTYFKVQNVLVALQILAVAMAAVIFMITPHQKFVEVFNHWASQYGSPSFDQTIALTNAEWPIPETWNWSATIGELVPFSWFAIYGYFITCIGGEVKSPRKNLFLGQFLNILISSVLGIWCILAFYRMVGWKFLHVQAYIDNVYPDWWKMPIYSIYGCYAAMLTNFNPVVGFIQATGYIGGDFLWVPASHIFFSRGLFAWGMDMLGPTWFTDVHPKFGTPVKLHLLTFILTSAILPQYCFWPEAYGAVSVETMQLVSVFGITSISCMIFPFRKKVRDIWEASPYKTWKVGPIPYATIAGALTLVYVGMLVYGSYSPEIMTGYMRIWTCIYIAVWVLGIAWYFIWKAYRARQGIDITLAFKELAPE